MEQRGGPLFFLKLFACISSVSAILAHPFATASHWRKAISRVQTCPNYFACLRFSKYGFGLGTNYKKGSMMPKNFHQEQDGHVWFVASIFDCLIKNPHCKIVFSSKLGPLRIINGSSGTKTFPGRSEFLASNPFCKFCTSEGKCSRHTDGRTNHAEEETNPWKT